MDDTDAHFEVPRQFIVLAAVLGLYAFLASLNVLHQIYHVATSKAPCTGPHTDIESSGRSTYSSTIHNLSLSCADCRMHIELLFNNETSKKRTIAFLKSKRFILLLVSIFLSFMSYGFIYTGVNRAMAASAMSVQIEAQAINLRQEEEVQRFDPHQILQLKPDKANNKRKINKAFLTLATKAVASSRTAKENNEDPSDSVQTLLRLHLAYRALTDEKGKENFLRYGHPNGPALMDNTVLPPQSIHILHPFISCLDPGSIIFLLTFIGVLALLAKTSPALRNRTNTIIKEKAKPQPPFAYFGGRAPKDIHAVCIDPSVATIESNAFRECTSLQTVEIPFSVKEVQKSAFRDCTSLHTVTFLSPPKVVFSESPKLSSSPKYLSNAILVDALSPCPSIDLLSHTHIDTNTNTGPPLSLTKTTTNDNNLTTIIGSSIFRGCRSLRAITLPTTLTKIPKSTFQGCTTLSSITPPFLPLLEKIGYEAFDGCVALRSVVIPPCAKKISACAFHSCYNLENVEVLSTMTEIGRHAFGSCPKMVSLPDGYSDENGRCGRGAVCGYSASDERICKDRGCDEIHTVGFQDGEYDKEEFPQYSLLSTLVPSLEHSFTSL
mmetsp:Transcript_36283/g.43331  ORF Transcript_36283/g.43331 Transcript_36283/m.43331 type:complete len:607 (-) Transcript_36283:200-2020(-)|eukprot:CAMPEP_0198269560 /NCGR_PEP_ID=MMETSP1447-20131203/41777_1 /TAXON_ID=420782 /ORGANISM="Chaetoceros dichaeta, Strain CCMP1751" /LENGTH=606 /DNA_ID=CAMNT_0043961199 /DNA_START=256 /DNA_END=2076 /DNA_ORIENTATION=+